MDHLTNDLIPMLNATHHNLRNLIENPNGFLQSHINAYLHKGSEINLGDYVIPLYKEDEDEDTGPTYFTTIEGGVATRLREKIYSEISTKNPKRKSYGPGAYEEVITYEPFVHKVVPNTQRTKLITENSIYLPRRGKEINYNDYITDALNDEEDYPDDEPRTQFLKYGPESHSFIPNRKNSDQLNLGLPVTIPKKHFVELGKDLSIAFV